MIRKTLACAGVLFLLFTGLAQADPERAFIHSTALAEPESLLDLEIYKAMTENETAGMMINIMKEGKLIHSKGYGYADLAKGKAITGDTIYRVASITKTLSAIAVMQLWEQGKIDINADISQYVGFTVRNPHFPDVPITLAQIMTHTAGFKDYYYIYAKEAYVDFNFERSIKELHEKGGRFNDAEELYKSDFAPGDPRGFLYSNATGFLLVAAVEKVSGERFDLYCNKHIFRPLKMTRTSFNIEDLESVSDDFGMIYRYNASVRPSEEVYTAEYGFNDVKNLADLKKQPFNMKKYKLGESHGMWSPQGGLRSSVNDLTRFMQMMMNRGELDGVRVLKESTVLEMEKVRWEGDAPSDAYVQGFYKKKGLQLHIIENEPYQGRTMYGHAGDAYGLFAAVYYDPTDKTGFATILSGHRDYEDPIAYKGMWSSIEADIHKALNIAFGLAK